jgi:hypothetical protein
VGLLPHPSQRSKIARVKLNASPSDGNKTERIEGRNVSQKYYVNNLKLRGDTKGWHYVTEKIQVPYPIHHDYYVQYEVNSIIYFCSDDVNCFYVHCKGKHKKLTVHDIAGHWSRCHTDSKDKNSQIEYSDRDKLKKQVERYSIPGTGAIGALVSH